MNKIYTFCNSCGQNFDDYVEQCTYCQSSDIIREVFGDYNEESFDFTDSLYDDEE